MLDVLLIGLSMGSILLLAALGLVIIYGAMGVVNMAHGEMIMVGAYAAVLAQIWLGLGLFAAIPIAFVVAAALGLLIERCVVRRLYGRLGDTLLATWGVAILVQQAVRLEGGLAFFGIHIEGLGPGLQNMPIPAVLQGAVMVGDTPINAYRAFIVACTVVLTFATWLLLYRTRIGMQVRAIIRNPRMAAACGIDVQRVNAWTFAFGAGLAGITGVLVAGFKTVSPDMGTALVVDSFLVVVSGGVGSLLGAVVTSIGLGEVTGVVAAVSNDILARAVVFGLVILLIVVRPQGLFSFKGR
ncbi:urea ABC transporter permease subunit UrtB [Variovorax paradoxus]|jgi:urea transport system permease protein|uniref:urea ABC transporter permease subunit UrtB n=1 Tax=Variovorax TaxID=34072 RepID=UPI0006E6D91A|nr:urea ABC transporter permease subunit UrtB [Variovorax sp.]KPU94917.1 urea ABC transporter permease subunit UrtB [Variovorax paradoxus]KPU97282.1 urea ABC transporter permease subunit UrtB [Variovorax paradoxus]KPV13528.1 urea ABC transporter permease subunit UrtB [Variovorax paradoxus]KPV15339.1 urea ABC transporter permease subunit UrtB [Variovorax paradoxus]KPV32777.1 urea ABC transporter permease subunit UrtB [Variovorax paradoxus]